MGGNTAAIVGGSLVQTFASAKSSKNALAVQAGQARLSESYKRLDIANKELDNQRKLRKSLASQANFFAGAGINASLGSAAQLQNNAFGNAALIADRSLAAQANFFGSTGINASRGSVILIIYKDFSVCCIDQLNPSPLIKGELPPTYFISKHFFKNNSKT